MATIFIDLPTFFVKNVSIGLELIKKDLNLNVLKSYLNIN